MSTHTAHQVGRIRAYGSSQPHCWLHCPNLGASNTGSPLKTGLCPSSRWQWCGLQAQSNPHHSTGPACINPSTKTKWHPWCSWPERIGIKWIRDNNLQAKTKLFPSTWVMHKKCLKLLKNVLKHLIVHQSDQYLESQWLECVFFSSLLFRTNFFPIISLGPRPEGLEQRSSSLFP